MFLTLEVTPSQASTLGSACRHSFGTSGGTIGRAASSDWVLSHRKVSGRHALITYQDGTFYLVDDSSANGVFLNSSKNRLIPGKRYALQAGDRIIIDPYEIEVSIADRGYEQSLADPFASRRHEASPFDPFGVEDPLGPTPRTPTPARQTPPRRTPPAGEVVPLDELDPLKLLEGSAAPKSVAGPAADDLEGRSVLSAHYQPPAVSAPSGEASRLESPRSVFEIPEGYDPLRDDSGAAADTVAAATPLPVSTPDAGPAVPGRQATPTPAPSPPLVAARTPPPTPIVPTPPPSPASSPQVPGSDGLTGAVDDPGLRAVLEGAGLERAPVTPEFARAFGQIFRVVVTGVMDVLRARQQIKDEFRMRMTQFRPADNNPLKFSANVDDALHNLLVKRNPAYLEPVEAFEDAFDDLRDHQIAMLAGLRVAFESMLTEFTPDHLQAQFDRQLKRGSLLGMPAWTKYWDLFRERHEEMVRDPEATFRRLFGDEFARAYEAQLQRLKAEAQARRGTPSTPEE